MILNYEVHFTISPECEIIKLGKTDDIRFDIRKKGKKNCLFGFHVLLTNTDKEESRLIALQKALQLCNLMSVKYRLYIKPILTGISKIKKDGTREVLVEKTSSWASVNKLNFDMKDKEIINLLHDSTMTKIYHHIAKGIESYYRSDHAESIRQFYQVVEHPRTKFPTLKKKYSPLRHALSHFGLICPRTITALDKKFGKNYFTLTSTNSFDYTSPSNLKNLEKEAECMFNIIVNSYSS
jgi:hypothetical protein